MKILLGETELLRWEYKSWEYKIQKIPTKYNFIKHRGDRASPTASFIIQRRKNSAKKAIYYNK